MIPRTPREIRTMQALAITAGICEEIAYRGFILWYLTNWMHVSLAIVIMAVAFGASHLYQGVKGAAQVAVIGAVAALLYLLSGSLWIPMVLHAVVDIIQLGMARTVLEAMGDDDPAPVAA